MAVKSDAAAGLSFAHLAGLAPVRPSAERTDEEVEQDRKDEDDETEDRRDDEDESTEDRRDKEDDDREDLGADEDEEDDGAKDSKEAKKARTSERTRWATVLGSKSFARNPALGARMLAKTGMSANAIVGMLKDTPAAGGSAPAPGASASRASRNPNVGSGGPAATKPVGSSLADRMLAARGAARK